MEVAAGQSDGQNSSRVSPGVSPMPMQASAEDRVSTGRRARTPGAAMRVELHSSGSGHPPSTAPAVPEARMEVVGGGGAVGGANVLVVPEEGEEHRGDGAEAGETAARPTLPNAIEDTEEEEVRGESLIELNASRVFNKHAFVEELPSEQVDILKSEVQGVIAALKDKVEKAEREKMEKEKAHAHMQEEMLEKEDEEQRLRMTIMDLQSKLKEMEMEEEKRGPDEPNENFLCPITQEIFKDPVVAADGHTYERSALERWFKNHNLSPLTGTELNTKVTYNNYTLRSIIQDGYKRAPTINKRTRLLATSKGMEGIPVTPTQALARREERDRNHCIIL